VRQIVVIVLLFEVHLAHRLVSSSHDDILTCSTAIVDQKNGEIGAIGPAPNLEDSPLSASKNGLVERPLVKANRQHIPRIEFSLWMVLAGDKYLIEIEATGRK
jgi:hypothetical protein